MSSFNSCFLFLDNPNGGVENLADMKAAGFFGVFCNVRDYEPAKWEQVILPRARGLGMTCGPWGRTTIPNTTTFDPAVVDLVVATADKWQQPLILNCEKEIDSTGAIITTTLAQKVGTRQAAISMEAWLFPTVDWRPVSKLAMLLQIFPVESPAAKDPDGCKRHAHDLGCECVYFTFGTYGGQSPADFDLKAPYSLFTGDAMGAVYPPWSPTSQGFQACEEKPVPAKWYEKPYLTGPPVGPDKLPRVLYAPSEEKGRFTGDDVTAFKRAVSRSGRFPWNPATWDKTYGEIIANGDGTGQVPRSGVKGFQRQTWRDKPAKQTGILNEETYQVMRRALVSDPQAVHYKEPILDSVARRLLREAAAEFSEQAKIEHFRAQVADFCNRAEAASSELWVYSQRRPFTGMGVPPERAHINDCSGYVILAYYWGRINSALKVPDPSGYLYNGYGNTFDDLDGHPRVTSGNYLVGDLAHYTGHVTICKRKGTATSALWSSFGAEPRPRELSLYYRPDLLKVVRPPLE